MSVDARSLCPLFEGGDDLPLDVENLGLGDENLRHPLDNHGQETGDLVMLGVWLVQVAVRLDRRSAQAFVLC